jgi:predicted SAM-dependent methyltransferase
MQNSSYKLSLKSFLKFEFSSWVSRNIYKNIFPFKVSSDFLNLGCGPRTFDLCDNVDVPVLRRKKVDFHGLDLRYPLPIPENSYGGVFSEHTLEHLEPCEAIDLLREVFRILKPGGVARIIVPSLDKYLPWLNSEESLRAETPFEGNVHAIWHLTQHYSHKSVWDTKTLNSVLLQIGFRYCSVVNFNEGHTVMKVFDSKNRAWESLYIEATK